MPKDSQVPDFFAWMLIGAQVYADLKTTEKHDKLIEYLSESPLDPYRCSQYIQGLKKIGRIDSRAYNYTLELLLTYPQESVILDLVSQTGQLYFKTLEPPQFFTKIELSQLQILVDKIKKTEKLILSLERGSGDAIINASIWLKELDHDNHYPNNVLGNKLVFLKKEVLKKYINLILDVLNHSIKNKKLQILLREALILSKDANIDKFESLLKKIISYILQSKEAGDLENFLEYILEKAPGVNTLDIYNFTLDGFEISPYQKSYKTLVLKVGRWHFSRKNWLRRKPKIEDEQQMQNDILMRLS